MRLFLALLVFAQFVALGLFFGSGYFAPLLEALVQFAASLGGHDPLQ